VNSGYATNGAKRIARPIAIVPGAGSIIRVQWKLLRATVWLNLASFVRGNAWVLSLRDPGLTAYVLPL